MKNNTILIGICGGTGSGKTTTAKNIASEFKKNEVTLIQLDSYYKKINNLILILPILFLLGWRIIC